MAHSIQRCALALGAFTPELASKSSNALSPPLFRCSLLPVGGVMPLKLIRGSVVGVTLSIFLFVLSPQVEATNRSARDLVVVVNLTESGRSDLKWLYKFMDASALSLAQLTLGTQYRQIHALVGQDATSGNFVSTLRETSEDRALEAIDVFLHLHGNADGVRFADDHIAAAQLGDQLAVLPERRKLRVLYSSACYGASHAPRLVQDGFAVASGAIATNANSAFEYPYFLAAWAGGYTFGEAIELGNDPLQNRILDAAAEWQGFTDVNSTKIIVGNHNRTLEY